MSTEQLLSERESSQTTQEREPKEVHTARTVMLAAWHINDEFDALSADRQRQLFGAAVFGRRKVRRSRTRDGFEVYRVVAYGQDYNISFWSYREIAELLNRGETVVAKKD